MVQYIWAGSLVLSDAVRENVYLEINQGQFGEILTQRPSAGDIIDYSAHTVAPGLVDTHIHGYLGHDVMDNDVEGLKAISEGLLSCGVTSWLPTTLTAPNEELLAVCHSIAAAQPQVTGAKIRGIFLEGPFFSEKYKGAQNEKYMTDPAIDKLRAWQAAGQQLVKKIAIAPERQGAEAFTQAAVQENIHVALAHSEATFAEAKAVVAAGANIFVHTFNAMSGLHHREPGMVGAALALDDVFAEIICDGHHVHPEAVRIVTKCRGKDESVLVTDCMRAGGQGEGDSRLGEFEVVVADGAARLKKDGHLAGSILTLITAVQNVVDWGIAPLAEALGMAALNPARSVGIDDVCGQIKAGHDADFIIIDQNNELVATYLNGEQRFSNQ